MSKFVLSVGMCLASLAVVAAGLDASQQGARIVGQETKPGLTALASGPTRAPFDAPIDGPFFTQGQAVSDAVKRDDQGYQSEIWYDDQGNIHGGTFMDYLVPTAMETPKWETDRTVTPSPHHPIGAKGIGESATVGAPPAIVNAVVDALSHLGVTHVEIPMTPPRMWRLLKEKGVAV